MNQRQQYLIKLIKIFTSLSSDLGYVANTTLLDISYVISLLAFHTVYLITSHRIPRGLIIRCPFWLTKGRVLCFSRQKKRKLRMIFWLRPRRWNWLTDYSRVIDAYFWKINDLNIYKQSIVATSACETKSYAVSKAIRKVKMLRNVTVDLCNQLTLLSTKLYGDSKAAKRKPEHRELTKLRNLTDVLMLRDIVRKETIKMKELSFAENPADIFIKSSLLIRTKIYAGSFSP